ncbi:MAG TPA: galactonate dehydratase [Acidobacteriaceae bacterium]|nr:galactonate dehydratase [Acidobacteriaceae bacterium]
MNRRKFLGGAAMAAAALPASRLSGATASPPLIESCGCDPFAQQAPARDASYAINTGSNPQAFIGLASNLKITNLKVFGVSITPNSDRPYVFVKIETNQGIIGWGEGTLEGKAQSVMSCILDMRDFLIGNDPMQAEHLWQSMYVHTFYRAGPVIGSAISAIDQALWDIRGKALNVPVYQLLGGPYDERGVRGYYHVESVATDEALAELKQNAVSEGVSCLKVGMPDHDYEWLEGNAKITHVVKYLERIRAGLGDGIDIAIDFHAKMSPSVAVIMCKEVEPLKLLWVEEPCPPENVQAMARVSRRSTTPIATGERLVATYGCRELIEMGIVDILQTDINHVGGISALWKVAAMANISDISMAPHACEGPIDGLATLHVDTSIPNLLVQEICSFVVPGQKEKIWAEWFGFPAMRMVNGRVPLPTGPGLGFNLTEEALAKYPFGGTKPMEFVYHADGSVAAL